MFSETLHLDLRNVLAWHHNETKEAASHVHLQGRCSGRS